MEIKKILEELKLNNPSEQVSIIVDDTNVYKKFDIVHSFDSKGGIFLKVNSENIETEYDDMRIGEDKFIRKEDGTIKLIRKN